MLSQAIFCQAWPDLQLLIFTSYVPHLLYYSHLPAATIALLLGLFVYSKKKSDLAAKILLVISIFFISWIFIDILLWTQPDSRLVMFLWSLINLLEMLVTSSTLYFSYVFLEKRDAPMKYKLIIGALFIVFIAFIPTKLNLSGFDIPNCEAIQGSLIYYFYFLEILFFLWLLIYLIKKVITTKAEERRKMIYFSIGAICFLASFSGANILGSIIERWEILQYGLFGMPIFMAFLVYLIVKYKAFNIRLISAQALVVALVVLIGSQFFFIQNNTNRILTGITLALVIVFGWWLVKSVKVEIKQRENLDKANKQLLQTQSNLEKATITLKVVNEQLAHANDHLKDLDKAKSEFMSITSHQLRTPLTGIMGYLSMILEGTYGEVDKRKEPILKDVFEASQRLIRMVNLFLNISRIEAGRFTFNWAQTDLYDVTKAQVHELQPPANKKGIELSIADKPKDLPKVMVDHDKIKDVILNLVDNAIKYTKEGSIKVSLAKKGKDKVELTVKDTGIGIEPKEAEKLFEKFTRGDGMARINPDGAGLGLFIAKKMVEGHHGKILVESEGVGKGSTFHVLLPIKQAK